MKQRALNAVNAAKARQAPEPPQQPVPRKDRRRPKAMQEGLIKRRFRQQNGRCYLCDRDLIPARHNHDDAISIEHVTPIALGGTNTDDNKLLAHRRCNSYKSSREPTDRELSYLAHILKIEGAT